MHNQLHTVTRQFLQNQLPIIRKTVLEKIPAPILLHTKKSLGFLAEKERLRHIFETVYQTLPFAVRVVIRHDIFVDFCLAQGERWQQEWSRFLKPAGNQKLSGPPVPDMPPTVDSLPMQADQAWGANI